MERFPTLRTWWWLHAYPPRYKFEGFLRVTGTKPPVHQMSYLNSAVFWIVANLIVTIAAGQIGYWVEPIIVTVLSLHYALQVTQAVRQQRKSDKFDLLSLYGGEFAAVNIARAQRYPRSGIIHDVIPSLIFVSLISCWSWSLPLNFASPYDVIFTAMIVVGGLRFVDYLQSFVSAALIALLISQQTDDLEASVWVVGWFLLLQLICYVGFRASLSLMFSTDVPHPDDDYTGFKVGYILNFIVQPMVLMVVREFINLILWQAVKRRLEA
jgi:hypothetical protein